MLMFYSRTYGVLRWEWARQEILVGNLEAFQNSALAKDLCDNIGVVPTPVFRLNMVFFLPNSNLRVHALFHLANISLILILNQEQSRVFFVSLL